MKHLYILAAFVLITASSCRFMGDRVRGNGVIKTEEKTVGAFKEVEADGDFKLIVIQGALQPVKLVGDANILSYILVDQEGEKVTIHTKDGVNLSPSGDLTVYVTSPNFKSIEVSGSSDIIGQTKISSPEELTLGASGAGDIKMEVDAPKISASISGSGSVTLKGQTKDVEIELSGAGHAYCYDLLSESTSVTISGAGSAQVYASVKLKAEVSGAGNIHYKGSPSIGQEISGAGSVEKAE